MCKLIGARYAVCAAAASAVLALGFGQSGARADDAAALPPASPFTLSPTAQPQYLDDAAAQNNTFTLQGLSKGTALGNFMDSYKLALTGYGEMGYTYNFRRTPGRVNDLRVFDVTREHLELNQAELALVRAVDYSATDWNVGGMIEMIYGEDARFIHSNGLNFYGSSNPQPDPENQFDLTQAYVKFNAPLGQGLLVQVGKFVTPLGYETINPTSNSLYSHSYLFGFAIPFTNTGVFSTYKLNDQWTFGGGVTRGWDQALKDSNSDWVDFIGQAAYAPAAIKNLTLTATAISGPEQPNDSAHWRTVLDFIATYTLGDQWSFAFNGDIGYEPDAGIGGKNAIWYGGAAYATYKLDTDGRFAITGRGEYFNDDDGARGIGSEVYEATLGVEISPAPKNQYLAGLMIRPEIREDWSRTAVFDGGTKYNQTTVAADLYYKF